MRKYQHAALAVLAALSLGVSRAKADDPAPAGPKVSFSGGIDTYYLFNGASAGSHTTGGLAPQPVGPSGRAFDTSDNTFRVGLAKFSVDAKESKAGGHIDLIYGQTADIINTGAVTPGTAIGLESAYVYYTPTPKWNFKMGKCATPIGFEVIESWSNLNYSRSYLYWDTIPVVHSMVMGTYTFNDKYNATAMVSNSGWNDEASTSLFKNALLQFIGNPSGKFGFVASILAGNKTGVIHTTRDVADINLNFNPTSALYVGLDVTYGQSTTPDVGGAGATSTDILPYNGAALYASYQLNPAWKVGARVERLNDKDGAAGAGAAAVEEGTLTLAYKVGNFLPRLEYRYDEAKNSVNGANVNAEIFNDPSRPSGFVSSQRTLTLSAAYTF